MDSKFSSIEKPKVENEPLQAMDFINTPRQNLGLNRRELLQKKLRDYEARPNALPNSKHELKVWGMIDPKMEEKTEKEITDAYKVAMIRCLLLVGHFNPEDLCPEVLIVGSIDKFSPPNTHIKDKPLFQKAYRIVKDLLETGGQNLSR